MEAAQARLLAAISLVAGVAFLVYILIAGLDTTGRHLFVLSLVRLGFLAGLIAFIVTVQLSGRLTKVGIALVLIGALLNVIGAVGHVVTDGWAFNPFESDLAAPPWYAYVIGGSALLFALGTVLVGIAAIWSRVQLVLAITVLCAGLFYGFAALDAIGHAIWTLPWLGVCSLTLALHQGRTLARA